PSPTQAGAPESFTVAAEDDNGNLVKTYNGTVHFTSSDSLSVLPADYTFTSVDAGQHTFSATLNTVGSQTLRATDSANFFVTGSQTGITVNPPESPSVFPSLLADINPGSGDSIPRDFVALDGFTLFVADDGVHGDSL